MELKLKKSTTDIYIISIFGELDLYNSSKLKGLIQGMIDKNVKKIIFDLKETDYIDSSGLGVFIYIFGKVAKENKNLKFCMCNIDGTVKKLIDLCKLAGFFSMAPSLNEAMLIVES